MVDKSVLFLCIGKVSTTIAIASSSVLSVQSCKGRITFCKHQLFTLCAFVYGSLAMYIVAYRSCMELHVWITFSDISTDLLLIRQLPYA